MFLSDEKEKRVSELIDICSALNVVLMNTTNTVGVQVYEHDTSNSKMMSLDDIDTFLEEMSDNFQ